MRKFLVGSAQVFWEHYTDNPYKHHYEAHYSLQYYWNIARPRSLIIFHMMSIEYILWKLGKTCCTFCIIVSEGEFIWILLKYCLSKKSCPFLYYSILIKEDNTSGTYVLYGKCLVKYCIHLITLIKNNIYLVSNILLYKKYSYQTSSIIT